MCLPFFCSIFANVAFFPFARSVVSRVREGRAAPAAQANVVGRLVRPTSLACQCGGGCGLAMGRASARCGVDATHTCVGRLPMPPCYQKTTNGRRSTWNTTKSKPRFRCVAAWAAMAMGSGATHTNLSDVQRSQSSYGARRGAPANGAETAAMRHCTALGS